MTEIAIRGLPLTCQSWEYEKPHPGGVVVAVDGSDESVSALETGAAIASGRGCALHAVSVVPPIASAENDLGARGRNENEQLRMSVKRSELAAMMADLGGCSDWTYEVIMGRAARSLSAIAARRGADLLVMGRRDHPFIDRLLGNETTLQVMRTCEVPVLAARKATPRPATIIVAVDFSDASERAAEQALDLVCGTSRIYLAHVESAVMTKGETIPGGEARYPGDIVVWFRRLMGQLSWRSGIFVEPVVLSGSVAPAITAFAERVGADVIAAGSHGHNRLERFLLGSVSTALVRNAKGGVLIAPPRF